MPNFEYHEDTKIDRSKKKPKYSTKQDTTTNNSIERTTKMPKPSHTTPAGKRTGEKDTFLEENHPNNEIRDVEIHTVNDN